MQTCLQKNEEEGSEVEELDSDSEDCYEEYDCFSNEPSPSAAPVHVGSQATKERRSRKTWAKHNKPGVANVETGKRRDRYVRAAARLIWGHEKGNDAPVPQEFAARKPETADDRNSWSSGWKRQGADGGGSWSSSWKAQSAYDDRNWSSWHASSKRVENSSSSSRDGLRSHAKWGPRPPLEAPSKSLLSPGRLEPPGAPPFQKDLKALPVRFGPYPTGKREFETARPEVAPDAPWRNWRSDRVADKKKPIDPSDLPLPPAPAGPPPMMTPVAPPVAWPGFHMQHSQFGYSFQMPAALPPPATPAPPSSDDVNNTMVRGLLNALGEIANSVKSASGK